VESKDLSKIKARSSFYERNKEFLKAKSRKYHAAHRKEISKKKKLYYRRNKKRFQDLHLRNKYGITKADVDRLFEAQGHCCAICERSSPGKGGWVVDHDHASDVVRGILCRDCNAALGLFKDNSRFLTRANDGPQRAIKFPYVCGPRKKFLLRD
jgi:Recombination endonuclease VII